MTPPRLEWKPSSRVISPSIGRRATETVEGLVGLDSIPTRRLTQENLLVKSRCGRRQAEPDLRGTLLKLISARIKGVFVGERVHLHAAQYRATAVVLVAS